MRPWILTILGGLFVIYLLAMEVIDMAGRYEYLENHAPKLLRWAEKKSWHRVLLVAAVVLLAANLYDLTKEFEPPELKAVFPAIPAPTLDSKVPKEKNTPQESPNSLRKQTLRLCDDLDRFLQERAQHWQDIPKDQNVSSEKQYRDFMVGTEQIYASKFKQRTLEIVRQLKLKGLDVGYLDAEYGAAKRAPMPDEIAHLRDLAHYLDANGNVTHF